jgi:hypothetical protein
MFKKIEYINETMPLPEKRLKKIAESKEKKLNEFNYANFNEINNIISDQVDETILYVLDEYNNIITKNISDNIKIKAKYICSKEHIHVSEKLLSLCYYEFNECKKKLFHDIEIILNNNILEMNEVLESTYIIYSKYLTELKKIASEKVKLIKLRDINDIYSETFN